MSFGILELGDHEAGADLERLQGARPPCYKAQNLRATLTCG
jgi:hypothetical protein